MLETTIAGSLPKPFWLSDNAVRTLKTHFTSQKCLSRSFKPGTQYSLGPLQNSARLGKQVAGGPKWPRGKAC